jgi:hypothetical protein
MTNVRFRRVPRAPLGSGAPDLDAGRTVPRRLRHCRPSRNSIEPHTALRPRHATLQRSVVGPTALPMVPHAHRGRSLRRDSWPLAAPALSAGTPESAPARACSPVVHGPSALPRSTVPIERWPAVSARLAGDASAARAGRRRTGRRGSVRTSWTERRSPATAPAVPRVPRRRDGRDARWRRCSPKQTGVAGRELKIPPPPARHSSRPRLAEANGHGGTLGGPFPRGGAQQIQPETFDSLRRAGVNSCVSFGTGVRRARGDRVVARPSGVNGRRRRRSLR